MVVPREELVVVEVVVAGAADEVEAHVLGLVVGRDEAVARDAQRLVPGQLRLGAGEVHLELPELVLQQRDDADAAVDGVAEAHVGLVGEGIDGVFTLVRV